MGYVRGIVEQGLSVADQKAPKCAGMVQDLVERALQVPQISKLSEQAKPLVDTLDAKLSTRVDAGIELYSEKKQLVIEKAQEAQEQYSAKKQLVIDAAQEKAQEAQDQYVAKKELVVEKALEQFVTKKQTAQDFYSEKKQLVIEKAQPALELYSEKKQLVIEKAQPALELYSAKKQLVIEKAQEAQEQYVAKKQLVLEKAQEAQEQVVAKKQLVIEKAQGKAQEAQEQYVAKKQLVLEKAQGAVAEAQAVWKEGSVAQLTVVQFALARVEGTRCALVAQRLVEAADLLLPKLRLAVPRTLSDLRAASASVDAPLKAKLEQAKLRAQQASGRAQEFYSEQKEVVIEKAQPALELYSAKKQLVVEQAAVVQGRVTQAAQQGKAQTEALAAKAYEELTNLRERVQTEVQALVQQHKGPAARALVGLFGEKAVTAGVATAMPLLPAGVQDWIAQVDSLD